MAPKKKGRPEKRRGRGFGSPSTVKVPKKAEKDKDKQGASFDFPGTSPEGEVGKFPKRSPGYSSGEEAGSDDPNKKLPRSMPTDEVPSVSPIDLRSARKKRKVFRANFASAINKMRKTLDDSKNLRIKSKAVKILSSIANDMVERFTDDAAKLTRQRNTDMVLVRSAEAAVKLNVPESLEGMCVVMSRRAVLRYTSAQATLAEKEAVLDSIKAAEKKGGKDPNKAEKDKKDDTIIDKGSKSSKKKKEIAQMSTDEFCREIRSTSRTLRDKLIKAQSKDKDKSGNSPAASSGLA